MLVMCHDHDGFLWIGSQTGMQRYDGTRFKNYFADVRDTAALQSDWVTAIFEDSKNRLWIGNNDGTVYTLNRATGKFYNYTLHAAVANRMNGIWSFAEDKIGGIWIAGHDGIYKLNEAVSQFEKMNDHIGLEKNESTGVIIFDAANNLWLNTYNGVKLYNQEKKKLYSKAYNPNHNSLFDLKNMGGLSLLSQNDFWFTGPGIFYKYNLLTKKIKAFTVDKPAAKKMRAGVQKENIGSLYLLQNGKVMIALAGRGIAIYNPANDGISIIESDNTKTNSYHANEDRSYLSMLQDREKNILVGSDAGINIYNPDKDFFKVHKRNNAARDFFPKQDANDFLELPDGNILIGYYFVNGGIVKADGNFHFIKQYLYHNNGNKLNGSNQVWNLFRDKTGTVWAPNQRNNILKLNLQTESITEEKDSFLNTPVISIKQDNEGTIWMGLWRKGLAKRNAATHKYTFYTDFLYSTPSDIKRGQCLLPEGDSIWIGTMQNGLQVFDKKKEKFTAAFVTDIKNKNSISSNCVTDILRYSKDTLIVATLMGVNIFDEKTKIFTAITTKEGLPNNLVNAIIKDGLGNVWVACFYDGFCKINMHDLSINSYGISDGLTDNIFTSKFYKLKNGNILMGGAESFFSFNPASFKSAVAPANVRITDIHVFENEVAVDSLLQQQLPLQLSYKENSIRIQFACLDYWNPKGIKYFYRLNGIDKNWILADRNQAAVYNQLAHGEYLFEVKCANRDGVYSCNITALKIKISPPFWKKWWFTMLAGLAIFSLSLMVIRWREKNIRAVAAEKIKVQQSQIEMYSMNDQLSKAKLEALRSQMNPHFIFNSLNAIQECILTNKIDEAYKYLSKFSKLQRMVLNNSQKELISLSDEIEMLQLYLSLESLRFSDSFSYSIDATGIADVNEIMLPSLITQPLVENAIWHGLRNKEGEKKLSIVYKESNGLFFITIDDNGIGREEAAMIKKQKIGNSQFASKGTIIVQQRLHVLAQQLKADIQLQTTDKKDEQDNAKGTIVVISFPSNLETG